MSSTSLIAVRDDSPMSKNSGPGPRAGGPIARRSFTPAQKLDHLAAYEDAILRNEGGAYLREQGVYSSQITEWRKLRDAGVLEGKPWPCCSRTWKSPNLIRDLGSVMTTRTPIIPGA